MALVPASSHGGGGNTTAQVVASGQVLPVADPTGVAVDTTTYANSVRGSGHYTTLVFPADEAALAIAVTGDAFPRLVLTSDTTDGLYLGNGTFDPYSAPKAALNYTGSSVGGLQVGSGILLLSTGAAASSHAPQLSQLSPKFTITSGALPTQTLASGTGAQVSTTRDVETVTPFSGDGTNNAATCAIALSSDNTTYSTLATISIAAALNLTGVLTDNVNLRVPAGWYIKLTAVHGTLGTTTYY